MLRLFCTVAFLAALVASGCATDPARPDPVTSLLEVGEQVTLRMRAHLLHGHDMKAPPYDAPEGYRPIPTYQGELLLTDRRLLFVEDAGAPTPSWLSIPYGAIARARPSQTPLLHYLVLWDADGHPDSFTVSSSDVLALHRKIGQEILKRAPGSSSTTRHAITAGE